MAAAVSQFALLTSITAEPDSVVIRNSYFGNNRARGTLVKTSNALLENNVFNHTNAHCIQANPDGCYWFESNGFTNWTVQNNTFLGCSAGSPGSGADIYVANCVPEWSNGLPLPQGSEGTVGQAFSQMAVVNNRFVQDEPHQMVALWGISGLRVTGNRVTVPSSPLEEASSDPHHSAAIMGNFDGFTCTAEQTVVTGWVVDQALTGWVQAWYMRGDPPLCITRAARDGKKRHGGPKGSWHRSPTLLPCSP